MSILGTTLNLSVGEWLLFREGCVQSSSALLPGRGQGAGSDVCMFGELLFWGFRKIGGGPPNRNKIS